MVIFSAASRSLIRMTNHLQNQPKRSTKWQVPCLKCYLWYEYANFDCVLLLETFSLMCMTTHAYLKFLTCYSFGQWGWRVTKGSKNQYRLIMSNDVKHFKGKWNSMAIWCIWYITLMHWINERQWVPFTFYIGMDWFQFFRFWFMQIGSRFFILINNL